MHFFNIQLTQILVERDHQMNRCWFHYLIACLILIKARNLSTPLCHNSRLKMIIRAIYFVLISYIHFDPMTLM